MIERVVGSNYRIVEKVGEGGMGAVFRAVDLMLEREVAIKAIRPELAREPDVVERFRAEARSLARVSHPAIATIYSFFQDGDELFLAMEYVRGRSLGRILEAEGALPWERAVRLLSSALDGIAEAHRAGIIHRDLKPDNLMITEAGTVKVMDFGIARMAGSGHLTRTGLLVGTLRYMAPEQIQGEEADQRSDVYALGGVLYQMLTGRPPFEGKSDYAILRAQIEEMPPPPSSGVPGLPAWLDRAVLRALAKLPADRFQSVEEMNRFLRARGGTETSPEVTRATSVPPAGIAELPTIVTPPRGAPAPVPTMPSGAVGTDTSLYQPSGSGAGWKLALAAMTAAGVIALLTGVGLALWNRSPEETASSGPPAPEETVVGSTRLTATPEPAAVTPPPVAAPTPIVPRPTPAQPRPTPAPIETPQESPTPAEVAAAPQPPAEPSPEPVEQEDVPAAPIDELRRLGSELDASSAQLLASYQAFLEQKEDAGGEITNADEDLEELIESFAGTAEKFDKQMQGGGFFARLRKRSDTEARPQLAKRARELADHGARVDTLMAQVQPSPEVRQAWAEIRRRWQRVGAIVSGLQ
jgi:serine/threonine-protein kinase